MLDVIVEGGWGDTDVVQIGTVYVALDPAGVFLFEQPSDKSRAWGFDDHSFGALDSEPEGRHFLMHIALKMKEVLHLLPAVWHGGRASRIRELHAFVFCAHCLL